MVPEGMNSHVHAFDARADGNAPAMQGPMTVTYLLTDVDGGTELVGVHEDLPPGVSPADNELGWTMSLGKLARLVEGRVDAPSSDDRR